MNDQILNIDEIIQQGWAQHDKEAPALALRLEAAGDSVTDAARAGAFAALVNHTIGEHLGDWPRAARLLSGVAGKLTPDAALSPLLCCLATAHFMAGNSSEAFVAEARAAAWTPEQPLSAFVRVRMLMASGLLGLKRLGECAQIYEAALQLASNITGNAPSDRSVAVTSNNLASELIELPERTPEQTATMFRAAHAAREFWLKAGNWMNDERADYLLALAHNAAGEHEKALEYAQRGLRTIEQNGPEPVDAAFLSLAAAVAHRGSGRSAEHQKALQQAEALAAGFAADAGLTDWFRGELAKAR